MYFLRALKIRSSRCFHFAVQAFLPPLCQNMKMPFTAEYLKPAVYIEKGCSAAAEKIGELRAAQLSEMDSEILSNQI